jgi:hypothetical protein
MPAANRKRLKELRDIESRERQEEDRDYLARVQRMEKLPVTQRWKMQKQYSTFKLPLREYLQREMTKKEVKAKGMPSQVSNFIQDCLK